MLIDVSKKVSSHHDYLKNSEVKKMEKSAIKTALGIGLQKLAQSTLVTMSAIEWLKGGENRRIIITNTKHGLEVKAEENGESVTIS